MATMNEFFQALGMFEGATKEYAIKQGINDATTAVQELSKMQDLDIDQKYAMQKQAATSLQAQLAGLGAPQTTIASAVGAIAPPDITTVEGARQLASLATTPDERLKYTKVAEDNAEKLGKLSLATKKPAMEAEQAFTAEESQKNRDLQWAIANIKKEAATAGKPIPSSELTKLNTADATLTGLASVKQQLASMKDEIGPISGIDFVKSWRKPEFGAFKTQVGQLFDSYRIAVTGAGASNAELEKLKQNTPTVKDPPALFEAKLVRWENTVKQIENSRLKRLQQIGYNTGELAPYDLSPEGKQAFKPYYLVTPGGRKLLADTPEKEQQILQSAKGLKLTPEGK